MSTANLWKQYTEGIRKFYSDNKKVVNIAGTSVIVVLALGVFWSAYWHPKREKEAGVKLAKLHHYFESDSFAVVLNGIKGKKMSTAPEIADSYGWTKKGKEAALMAGIAFLQTGKYEKALKYLDKTDAEDIILGPSILAAKAACYAELGKPDKAAAAYEKASDKGKNDFTAQFLKKAGIQYELAKDYKNALRCYEKLRSDYSKTTEVSDIDKYIYRAKGMLGELNN